MLIEEAMRARPSMGVLCMSGYDPSPTHRDWLSIQNIALLEKPFSQTSLARALEHALGR
jgi:DNA-binding NtrC family response regulator